MPRSRLVALLADALLVPAACGAAPFRFPEARFGKKAELKYVNKVPVLVVEGTPEEIGTAAGTLVVKPAVRVLDYPRGLIEHFSGRGLGALLWKQAIVQGRAMEKHFPADYHKELKAMEKASGAPWESLVAGNTLFDIKKLVLCSALLVEGDRSATRGPLVGRNLDYPSLGYVQDYSLVTVYRPKGKHAFVSVGFPGLIGCLSGMNDAGLTVAVLEDFGARKGEGRFDSTGIPYALNYRTLLEECATIEEAQKRLEKLPRTTIMNLIVADRRHVGVFEITPKTVVFRPAEKGTCSCTNHFLTEVKPAKPVDMAHSYDRFDSLEAARKLKGRLTVEDVRRELDKVNLGSLTLQTMVFEPATLKLHLGIGETPSSAMKLRALDLAPLLKPKR